MAKFKNTYNPASVSHPSETLREWVDESGISKMRCAANCGIDFSTFKCLYEGTMCIDETMAKALESGGIGCAEFWNARVARYHEWVLTKWRTTEYGRKIAAKDKHGR